MEYARLQLVKNYMKNIIQKNKSQFGLSKYREQKNGLSFVVCPKKNLVSFMTSMKNNEGFTHLAFFTVVDFIEDKSFQLTYMIHNYDLKLDCAVLVMINRKNPVMESIHRLWEQAKVYERENREMFGIEFPGCPRVDENFALEGWDQDPPMRRDFDTKKYSEETYFPRHGRKTYDPRDYMKSKLYSNGDE